MRKRKIDLYPTVCNLCEGHVEYVSNAAIYGRQYGSGFCYRCTACGAYVGTHRSRPKEAIGILADAEMRDWKKRCHEAFDAFWKTTKEPQRRRSNLYIRLAGEMRLEVQGCHFGYFGVTQLKAAYKIIQRWQENPPEELDYEPANKPCIDCHLAEWEDMYGVMVFACDMKHCIKAEEDPWD